MLKRLLQPVAALHRIMHGSFSTDTTSAMLGDTLFSDSFERGYPTGIMNSGTSTNTPFLEFGAHVANP